MRKHFSFRIKLLWTQAWALILLGMFFQTLAFATTVNLVPDGTQLSNNLPNPPAQNVSTLPVCSYTATDTMIGTNNQSGYGSGPFSTESNGSGNNAQGQISMPSYPLTNGTNDLVLGFRGGSWSSTKWYNGSWNGATASPLSTPVPCTGVYQVFFTLQLQATYYNTGTGSIPAAPAPSITVYPCVQTTDGATLVYGSLLVNNACPSTGPSFTFNPVCNGGNYCTVMTFPFSTQVYLTAGQIVGAPVIHTSAQVNVTGGDFTVVYLNP